jgi:hypothetical protein
LEFGQMVTSMMRLARMGLGLAAAGSLAAAASAAPGGAEAYIRAAEAAWAAAEVTGDPSVARRFLAEDYTGVFPDGVVAHKAQAVAYFTPAHAIPRARLDYLHVRVFGAVAIAQGQETDVRPAGGPIPGGRLIFTDVWLLRHGQWQIVNSEDQLQPLPKR